MVFCSCCSKLSGQVYTVASAMKSASPGHAMLLAGRIIKLWNDRGSLVSNQGRSYSFQEIHDFKSINWICEDCCILYNVKPNGEPDNLSPEVEPMEKCGFCRRWVRGVGHSF